MTDNRPACFGDLDQVFPMGDKGLRRCPSHCLACAHKTPCLKIALEGENRLLLADEKVDRSYHSGNITFLQRWSRKKTLHRTRNYN